MILHNLLKLIFNYFSLDQPEGVTTAPPPGNDVIPPPPSFGSEEMQEPSSSRVQPTPVTIPTQVAVGITTPVPAPTSPQQNTSPTQHIPPQVASTTPVGVERGGHQKRSHQHTEQDYKRQKFGAHTLLTVCLNCSYKYYWQYNCPKKYRYN